MKSKKVLAIVVPLFMFIVVLGMLFNASVHANPIPVPTLLMPNEYIDATISQINGVPWAIVDGEYPFENIGVNYVTMYYPVPPNSPAEKISVKIDDTSLSWSYCEPPKMYPTVVGDFPMIQWDITPVPAIFTIKTHYEHPLPLINGNYSFLYASGTGRYLGDPYAEETTAYVKMYISYDVATEEDQINVYTIANVSGNWIWNPANYDITPEAGKWKINLTLVSEPFAPLEEDTLVTIQSLPVDPVGGIYIPVNKLELLAPYLGSAILSAVAVTAAVFFKHKKNKS